MGKLGYFGLLVLLVLPLFVQGVFDHALWLNDEGHVAEIGREMFLSGDVVVPRLGGQPFVEKPPLYFMAMGVCYRWFGITPGAARLPSAVFGFLTVLVVYGIGAAQGRPRLGLLAAFLLATVSMLFRYAHWCVVDAAVCFFTTLAFYLFSRGYQSAQRKFWWYFACHAACAFAFMCKGLMAPGMVGVAVIALLIWDGNVRELRHMGLWAGLPLVALLIGPWLYMLWAVGGMELIRGFLIDNNLGRFCSTVSARYPEHARGFFYYFYDFPNNFLPWTPLLFPALVWAFRQARARQTADSSFYRFVWAGFVLNILLASFSATKRGVYILPLYPLAALMVGGWLDDVLAGRPFVKWERLLLWVQTLLLCIAPLILLAACLYLGLASVPVLVLLGVVCLALSIYGVRALWVGRLIPAATSLGVQVILTYTLIVQLIFPLVGPYKHYTAFFERVAEVVQPGDLVLAYANIHEANLGQACISLNRLVPVFWGRQRLAALLSQQQQRVFIFVEEWNYPGIKRMLPPGAGVYWSQPMTVPLRGARKPVLRCFTNVAGAQRPALFQTLEKDNVPLSRSWNTPALPCGAHQP